MLDAIKQLSGQTQKLCEDNGSCRLREVANLVEAFTEIDEVRYLRYEVAATNPVWGQFAKWQWQGPYDGVKTKVQVRYASHLGRPERRFVVSKELCHALEVNHGSHSASDQDVTDLVNELAVASASSPISAALTAEKMAELGAVELISPLALRKQLIVSGELARIGLVGMSERFGLPQTYTDLAFHSTYMEIVESILS